MLKWLKKSLAGANSSEAASASPSQALLEQGNALLAQDKFAEAASCYGRALELDPQVVDALVNLGFAQAELGLHAQARTHLEQASKLASSNPDAFYLLGISCEALGDRADAIAAFRRAVTIQPGMEPALQSLCRLLARNAQLDEAKSVLDQACAMDPDAAWPYLFLGNLQLVSGQFANAATSLKQAVARAPGNPRFHSLLGTALQQHGALDEAIACYKHASELDPADADAFSNLGNALRCAGRLEQARQACLRALALDPAMAAAHNNMGAVLMELGEAPLALVHFERAIALQPDAAQSHGNLGVALGALKRHDEALASFDTALRLKPDLSEALNNRGNTLQEMGRPEEALACHDAALRIEPANAEALNRRGSALRSLGRLDDALRSYEAALASQPGYAPALINIGNLLSDMNRLTEAVAAYDHALRSQPDNAEALFNRGNTLRHLNQLDEALASYERALALKPDLPYLFGNWLHARMQVCDWRGLDAHFAELGRRIDSGQLVNPFILLPTNLSAAQQLHCTQVYAAARYPAVQLPTPVKAPSTAARIRLGYFSADFHDHATAWLMAQLFELHDRTRFELVAFSFGPDVSGGMRSRLEKTFDQFHVVRGKSDREVALLARQLGIDIAVDLKGYTQNARPGIFAFRPAPVQVSYLGYPGTMGAPFIDYILADATVLPDSLRPFFSEKVVHLPGSYQVNDSTRQIAQATPTRAEAGLPEKGFVFCCFNNNYKITPDLFDVWMRLLMQVDGSVLWLLLGNHLVADRLRSEASARGVDPSRLVFAGRLPLPEHLARHRLADLFLDTTFCNAHTTASDALWAGLPVLTLKGQTFAARVAASLCDAAGLAETVVVSLPAYEALALELATDKARLAGIRAGLAQGRMSCPLFDSRRFATHLESAFAAMWARHEAGLAPDHFSVV
ncbi:MAG: tetratricopeptide repeat protein [Burkholderiaceae bacterium]|nr:tetratricopeptide repeat protein [Burkholderiaceae bacterium]